MNKTKTISHSDKISVIGMGITGLGVAEYLEKNNYNFTIWDDNPKALNLHSRLQKLNPDYFNKENVTKIILSPGIKPKHRIYNIAKNHNIPIHSDYDIFVDNIKGKIIAISGTNGKSTTTLLIYHILKSHGLSCAIGGNVGHSLTTLPIDKDYYVIELSSAQLATSQNIRSDISVLLNITPDHLDMHIEFKKYIEAKEKIFINSNLCILNIEDSNIKEIYNKLNKEKIGFTKNTLPNLNSGYKIAHGNKTAAFLVAKSLGLNQLSIRRGIETFLPLKHKYQFLGKIKNTEFINDSKSTNIASTKYALDMCEHKHIFLILGGVAKTYNIDEILNPNIHTILLIGKSSKDFAKILDGKAQYIECDQLQNAVDSAYSIARTLSNSVILLSPACSSFDQWKNFEARGDKFISIFQQLQRAE